MSTLNSFVAKIMVIGIILAFIINFGPQAGTACTPNQGPAIVVNGEEISAMEYSRAYTQQLRQRTQQARGEFTTEQAQAEGFPKKVADSLVETRLLAAEAKRRGLAVGDGELRDELKRIFDGVMPEGGWDQQEYELRVRSTDMTVPEFENSFRRQLSAQKVTDALMWAAEPTEAELKDAYQLSGNRARFQLVLVKLDAFKSKVDAPDEAAIEAWAKENDEKIKDAYSADESRWTQNEEVKARHILAKVPKNADLDTKKKAKAKIEAVIGKLKDGADFVELAKTESEGPSASKGGDLGWFGRGAMVKPFEEAAFGLEPGGLSGVVESSFGFHVIKVEEKKAAGKTPLEDARSELSKELMIKEKTSGLARIEADRIQKLTASEGFEGLEKSFTGSVTEQNPLGWKASDSNWIRLDSRSVPGVGSSPGLAHRLLKQKEKGICPQVYSTESGFLVCEMTDKKEADEAGYAEAVENLRFGLKYPRQTRLRQELVQELRSNADIRINWDIVRVPGSQG
ncbi:MAG: peptidylprolyl isomerase [Myxococcota bacterium]|jgi:peptidyl-prolyl cis-trans isomerase D|nr:peptidylprolyl isomerase [Myxococcota bacterium]